MINKIANSITNVDSNFRKTAEKYTNGLAMPTRAMGQINELSEKLATIQHTLKPDVSRRELFIMAGDHGVYDEGVAPYPQEVTMQILQMMLVGRSSVCVYAKHTNTAVTLVDLGVKKDVTLPKDIQCTFYNKKIGKGTANLTKGRAMTEEQAIQSITIGYEIASAHIQKNHINLVTTGEMGVANTTPAAAICAVLCDLDIEKVTGYGSGLNKEGWVRKVSVVKRGLEVNKPIKDNAIDILSKVGGYEIGGMAGVILAAAANKVPVVLDGYICTAAAALATLIAPATKDYMIAGHESEEFGHKYLLEKLGLKPLLRLGMRLGEGTGAVCAIPLIEFAAATIGEIATLKDAGVEVS